MNRTTDDYADVLMVALEAMLARDGIAEPVTKGFGANSWRPITAELLRTDDEARREVERTVAMATEADEAAVNNALDRRVLDTARAAIGRAQLRKTVRALRDHRNAHPEVWGNYRHG